MKKYLTLALICATAFLSSAQCLPDPDVIAQEIQKEDGVLYPWVLDVYPGQEVNMSITVLAPPDGVGSVRSIVRLYYRTILR